MSAGKIFYYLNAALITGIALGSFLYAQESLILVCILFFGLIVFYVYRLYTLSAGVVLLCGLGAFLVISQITSLQIQHDALVAHTPFEFVGEIIDIHKQEYRYFLTLSYDDTVVRVSTYSFEFSVGDMLEVNCSEIRKDLYLPLTVSRGILADCSESQLTVLQNDNAPHILNRTRKKLLDKVNIIFPSPEAELLQGLLLGKQANLPNDLDEDLQRTGTTHIVVLSGFNITIIAFVINKLIRRFRVGIQGASLLSIFFIWMFVLLAGFSPPTVRAAIMVSMVLLAQSRGRAYGGIFALMFSATILLIINPLLFRWSLSFQLSFLATVGVLFKDRFVPTLSLLPDTFSIRENIRTTIGATFLTLPLLITTFGSVSFVALITNAFILSLIPITMALGVIVLGITFFSIPIAITFGVVVYALLRSITYVIEFFADFSFAYADVPEYFSFIIFLIVVVLFFLKRGIKTEMVSTFTSTHKVLTQIIMSVVVVSIGIFLVVRGENKITFFDVGQGDAIHIRSENNYDILVDAGPDETVVSRLGRTMPYFDRTIELFVLTHPHADHLTGFFSIIEKYSIEEIWITGVAYDSPVYKEFIYEIKQRNLATTIITDEVVQERGDIIVKVLWPPNEYSESNINNTSIVLQLEKKGKKILFMGDAEKEVEKELVKQYGNALHSDVLKVGHHGANNVLTKDFISTVNPLISVISVGENNQFHHPHVQTMFLAEEYSGYVLRTDTCGNIGIIITKELVVSAGCETLTNQ